MDDQVSATIINHSLAFHTVFCMLACKHERMELADPDDGLVDITPLLAFCAQLNSSRSTFESVRILL